MGSSTSRGGVISGRLDAASSAHDAPEEPLSGRPAGISFSQVAFALVNWDEFVSMLDGMSNETLLLWNVGSGKPGNPCERMQAAAVAVVSLIGRGDRLRLGLAALGSGMLQAPCSSARTRD